MLSVGGLVASATDAYVASVLPRGVSPPYGLAELLSSRTQHKARLLYYFPLPSPPTGAAPPTPSDDDMSSWCGWHLDHGSLTALAPAVYFDGEGNLIPCPDPAAGLYIKASNGEVVRVEAPPGSLAFQIGETAQLHSGGVLRATPHCVRGPAVSGVSRATLALFMQPGWGDSMAAPAALGEAERAALMEGAAGRHLPPGVPSLASRWAGAEQTFGEFNDVTARSYYDAANATVAKV